MPASRHGNHELRPSMLYCYAWLDVTCLGLDKTSATTTLKNTFGHTGRHRSTRSATGSSEAREPRTAAGCAAPLGVAGLRARGRCPVPASPAQACFQRCTHCGNACSSNAVNEIQVKRCPTKHYLTKLNRRSRLPERRGVTDIETVAEVHMQKCALANPFAGGEDNKQNKVFRSATTTHTKTVASVPP